MSFYLCLIDPRGGMCRLVRGCRLVSLLPPCGEFHTVTGGCLHVIAASVRGNTTPYLPPLPWLPFITQTQWGLYGC